MNPSDPPSGVLDPKNPWYKAKVGDRTWNLLKAKLTGKKMSDGTQFSSTVNLTDADADKLIANLKKDPRGYPQFDDKGGGADFYENYQKYQEWLVEEYLEKPFREQTNKKIEDAAIASRLKEIEEERKRKAAEFVSRQPAAQPQRPVTPRVTTTSSIIPRAAVPQQVLETIQQSSGSGSSSPSVSAAALGRISLDLEQTKNNLDTIAEVIAEDYKNTREQNKKEVEEYRKRVANRGRVLGKRELGDKKSDVLGVVKKYVGSFFSGVGGSIRGLAMFNLLQGLMSGDPAKIIGPLLGIGITYIPNIIGGVIGSVIGGAGKGLLGRLFGGGSAGAARGAAGAAEAAGAAGGLSRLGRLGRFGGRAALIGGGIALASSMFNRPGEGDDTQQRLETLTEQQKGSTDPQNLVPIPQDDLKRFESLNKKFDEALDFLLKKQKEGSVQSAYGPGGGSSSPGPSPSGPVEPMAQIQDEAQGLAELGMSQAQYNAYKSAIAGSEGARYNEMGGAGRRFAGRYQMGAQEIAEAAAIMGLPAPTQQEFLNNPALQEKLYMGRTVQMYRIMMQDPNFSSKSPLERMALLAGTQLGAGNLKKYLRGERVTDSAGVPITHWIDPVRRALAGVPGGAPPSASPPVSAAPAVVGSVAASTVPQPPPPQVVAIPAQQQESPQASSTASGNDIVPSISTMYSENFLTLYSKLIYQIV